MRADIERDVVAAASEPQTDPLGQPEDPFGSPATVARRIHSDLPCFVWGTAEETILDGEKAASIGLYKMLVPYETDVRDLDRVTSVIDDKGRPFLTTGRMRILSLIKRRGWWPRSPEFQELTLEQIE